MKKVVGLLTIVLLCSSCWSISIKQRPWETDDRILAGVSTAASLWNMYETERIVDRGYTEDMFHFFSDTPSDEGIILTMSATQLITLFIADKAPVVEIRNSDGELVGDFELRKPLLGAKAGVNTGLAISDRNLRK